MRLLALVVLLVLALVTFAFAADGGGFNLPPEWDGQVTILMGWIAIALTFLKTLPYIGKYIQGDVALYGTFAGGVACAFIRAYILHDKFYGVPPKILLIIVVGLVAGYCAAYGYKLVAGLITKAVNGNKP